MKQHSEVHRPSVLDSSSPLIAEAEKLHDDLLFFYVNWKGPNTAINNGRRDMVLKSAECIRALLTVLGSHTATSEQP